VKIYQTNGKWFAHAAGGNSNRNTIPGEEAGPFDSRPDPVACWQTRNNVPRNLELVTVQDAPECGEGALIQAHAAICARATFRGDAVPFTEITRIATGDVLRWFLDAYYSALAALEVKE
jgi:hypothetical protein